MSENKEEVVKEIEEIEDEQQEEEPAEGSEYEVDPLVVGLAGAGLGSALTWGITKFLRKRDAKKALDAQTTNGETPTQTKKPNFIVRALNNAGFYTTDQFKAAMEEQNKIQNESKATESEPEKKPDEEKKPNGKAKK